MSNPVQCSSPAPTAAPVALFPASEPATLAEAQAYARDIRQDLLSGEQGGRVDGLRRLYVEIAERGDLWFDRLGHVARVDDDEGYEAGLVELLLCLVFAEEWPPAELV